MKCKCKEIKSIDLDKIERIPIPKYPKWYEDEMQKRVDFIKSVSGVSPELMGPVEEE